jgi:hypothetical protein
MHLGFSKSGSKNWIGRPGRAPGRDGGEDGRVRRHQRAREVMVWTLIALPLCAVPIMIEGVRP